MRFALALRINNKSSGGICRKHPLALTAKNASLTFARGMLTCHTGRNRLPGTWQDGEACHARGDNDMRRTPQLAGRCMKTKSATPAACTGECSESAHLANPPSLAQLNHVASGPIPSRWGSCRHCSAETSSSMGFTGWNTCKCNMLVLQRWGAFWHNLSKLRRGGSETTPPNPQRLPMPSVRR